MNISVFLPDHGRNNRTRQFQITLCRILLSAPKTNPFTPSTRDGCFSSFRCAFRSLTSRSQFSIFMKDLRQGKNDPKDVNASGSGKLPVAGKDKSNGNFSTICFRFRIPGQNEKGIRKEITITPPWTGGRRNPAAFCFSRYRPSGMRSSLSRIHLRPTSPEKGPGLLILSGL